MPENQYREVDPYAITVSEQNERRSSPVTNSIQESIAKQGVIQPPLVRERDAVDDTEVPYEVIVGQRRVLGAQATAGIDSIPVVVVEWDDAEALEASITENIDAFSEDVSDDDRAAAILRLMKMRGYNQTEVARQIGVSPQSIQNWLESSRDEWEGTAVKPSFENQENQDRTWSEEIGEGVRKPSGSTLREVRLATGGGERGEKMVKEVAQGKMTKPDVSEVHERVRAGEDVDKAIAQVKESKEGDISYSLNYTVSGEIAESLDACAKANGTSKEEVARWALEAYLESEGWFE